MNERAKQIAEALEKVESTHRAHGRALVESTHRAHGRALVESTHRAHGRALIEFHKLIASAVREYGPQVGLDGEIVAQAAAPKNPPTNETGD